MNETRRSAVASVLALSSLLALHCSSPSDFEGYRYLGAQAADAASTDASAGASTADASTVGGATDGGTSNTAGMSAGTAGTAGTSAGTAGTSAGAADMSAGTTAPAPLDDAAVTDTLDGGSAAPSCADAPCDPRATCSDADDGASCECPSGYTGDGIGDEGCTDIDECAQDEDDCDESPQACVNTQGGFACECPSGYEGDGEGNRGCSDVDECADDDTVCGPDASCSNTDGAFACDCGCGYEGDGGSCTMVTRRHGYDAELTGSESFPTQLAIAIPIEVTQGGRLLGFGARIASVGIALFAPSFSLALYEDDDGEPGERIARSEEVRLTTGTLALPPRDKDACSEIPAGTYWLAGVASSGPLGTHYAIGQDPNGASLPLVTRRVSGNGSLPGDLDDLDDEELGETRPLNLYLELD